LQKFGKRRGRNGGNTALSGLELFFPGLAGGKNEEGKGGKQECGLHRGGLIRETEHRAYRTRGFLLAGVNRGKNGLNKGGRFAKTKKAKMSFAKVKERLGQEIMGVKKAG